MRDYELVVILKPDLPEDELTSAVERVHQSVRARGGEVAEVDNWGRRKLAYPIKSHIEGNYVVNQIRLDPERTRELEAGLLISEDVIRHLLVRKDED